MHAGRDVEGHLLSDPIPLRLCREEFWLSLGDPDLAYWFKGVGVGGRFNATISEIAISPPPIQGLKSEAPMVDLFGERVRTIP